LVRGNNLEMRLVLTALLGVVVPLIACAQTYSIETFAGGGLPPNALGTSIGFFLPQSVAVDNRGNVYFADRAYVFRLDATTSILTVVAGSGAMGFSGYNGRATSAQLNNPHGVAVDATGSLYIADWVNNRVRKVTSGVITTIAGTGSQGFSGDNGPATSAQLNQPQGVSVDSTGSLYIADW